MLSNASLNWRLIVRTVLVSSLEISFAASSACRDVVSVFLSDLLDAWAHVPSCCSRETPRCKTREADDKTETESALK